GEPLIKASPVVNWSFVCPFVPICLHLSLDRLRKSKQKCIKTACVSVRLHFISDSMGSFREVSVRKRDSLTKSPSWRMSTRSFPGKPPQSAVCLLNRTSFFTWSGGRSSVPSTFPPALKSEEIRMASGPSQKQRL